MADLEHKEKETYALELTEAELCWIFRLVLLELKSGRPGPAYGHALHLLVEKMRTVGEDCECVEEYWEEDFGGSLTIPEAWLG
jgi:hypothetical protein